MTSGDHNMIEADGLTKTFGRFVAVDRLALTVGRGEVFGFLGPNGAGKSTTIRMLCGLLLPTSGAARVGGFDVSRDAEKVRENIGYMSQRFSLYRDLTVAENVAFFGGVYGLRGAALRERARDVLQMAGLQGMDQSLTGTLSGAIQQRLALGCAVLHKPPILFLDEPTSGVDPVARRMFWDLIHDLSGEGITVLITTHFLDEAEFCGRVGLIAGGRLVALDTPAALKRSLDEDLFEVGAAELTETARHIRAFPGIRAVSCFGPRLHVFGARGAYTAQTMAGLLRARLPAVETVQAVDVSLEDAFVRLIEQPRTVAT
jgi:ABC-2 type transport system ATP-binding protein